MNLSSMGSKISAKIQEKEGLAVLEVVGAAAGFAFLNAYKSNAADGSYRIALKSDGTGGIPVDGLAGALLVLFGLLAPPKYGSHMVALGAGALTVFGNRYAEQKGATRRQQMAQQQQAINNLAPQTSSGTLSAYNPNARAPHMFGPVDPYVAGFGASPVYRGRAA